MTNLTKLFMPLFLLSIFFFYACGSEPVELSDHKWKATNVAGAAASKEKLANLTLEFREDQEIGGFAGCNEYRGGATYNQQQIKFSTLYTDNETCDDSALERAFLKNLESGSTYTYQGSKLAIHDESGNIVVEMEQI
ncbi:META domain-containing protein [Lunatibacter salilacus]|uniref:META domain-containing protein n=1 Tax=Lunatibacter salilacus TaxID=2483804 RepID=UPI00131EA4C6|nr:META domain-containing protein [Lunatibacter salilacus]